MKGAHWTCPTCGRVFRQVHQRHSCSVGTVSELLAGRPEPLVRIYRAAEQSLKKLGGVEIVPKGRYVLFRTTRVFADAVFMRDAFRLAIVLERAVNDPVFVKAGKVAKRVVHVALLRSLAELERVMPYLREAYEFSRREREGDK